MRFAIMAGAAAYSNWDTISGIFERAVTDADETIYGQYVQHCFQMKDQAGAYSDRERGMVGVHWINTTGGDLDTTWTSADFALIEAGFSAFWSGMASNIPTEFRLVEHRWYPFGPGVLPPNPPSRVTTLGTPVAGSGGTVVPHQVSQTFTLRTPLRRHWGRIYMPIYSSSNIGAGAQYTSAAVDAWAGAFNTYIKSGSANGLCPVVWDRLRHVALGVTAVEADSVPDIIRRRRPRQTAYKKILTS